MIGSVVGDYRIVEQLGAGGFGEVYKVLDLKLEREVALKTMDVVLTRDPKFRERFFTEAKIQARLKHPNIVTIHTFFEQDGRYFIVMELMEGMALPNGRFVKSLAELIQLGPIPEVHLREIFCQILSGVAYAHQHGVLHRDLKPLNTLFAESGLVKVSDFGIAKIIGGDTNISVSGTRVGTPAYMSPEQVLNKPLDRRTDIYSLGCVLYEMAAGAMPFKATSTTSIEEQHLTAPPPPPREMNPWLSAQLEGIILKAMEKKPEDRFQTCEEFLAAFEERERKEPDALVRTVPEEKPPVAVNLPRREERKHKAGVRGRKTGLILGVSIGLIVAVLVVYLVARRPASAVAAEFPLPNLAGLSLDDARRLVEKHNLQLVADSALSDDVAKGTVLSSNPVSGTKVCQGDTVRVTWCWGRKTCQKCHTPRKGTARFCTRCGYAF